MYCKSLDYAFFVSLPHGAMPGVGLQSVIVAFLGHTLSLFETTCIIIVDDNTIVLHKMEL